MYKEHFQIINRRSRSYLLERSVNLGASLAAFHTQGLK